MATNSTTYFSNKNAFYSALNPDGTIPTEEFLRACHGIVEFLGMFGTVFSPVKNDIGGNVTKVNTKFQLDRTKFVTLQSLTEADLKENGGKIGHATEGLLWLKRGLEFIRAFLDILVEDHVSGKKSEDIVKMLHDAYEKTLKRHHGFFSKKLFGLMIHATPYRRDLLRTLALGQDGLEDQCIKDIQSYMPRFGENVDALVKFYYDKGLETQPGKK